MIYYCHRHTDDSRRLSTLSEHDRVLQMYVRVPTMAPMQMVRVITISIIFLIVILVLRFFYYLKRPTIGEYEFLISMRLLFSHMAHIRLQELLLLRLSQGDI